MSIRMALVQPVSHHPPEDDKNVAQAAPLVHEQYDRCNAAFGPRHEHTLQMSRCP